MVSHTGGDLQYQGGNVYESFDFVGKSEKEIGKIYMAVNMFCYVLFLADGVCVFYGSGAYDKRKNTIADFYG